MSIGTSAVEETGWRAMARLAFANRSFVFGLFVTALIECEAEPGSAAFFLAEEGDYLAAMTGQGEVAMYYVHDCAEDDHGRRCVLIRDDQPLD